MINYYYAFRALLATSITIAVIEALGKNRWAEGTAGAVFAAVLDDLRRSEINDAGLFDAKI